MKTLTVPPTTTPPHPARWTALRILLLAAFMDLVDATVVNVALPSIGAQLVTSTSMLRWMVAGYTLALGIGLVTGGRLGDLRGRRPMFLLGVAAFTLSSLMAGLAPSGAVLVLSRVLQGASAALMIPQILALVHDLFPAEERPAAFGLYGAVTGLAAVCGPILGGFLSEHSVFGLGWRSIFLINVPVGVVAFELARRRLPRTEVRRRRSLDPVGMTLLTLTLLCLLLPLIEGQHRGWPAWAWALLLAVVPGAAWFLRHERRQERAGADPLLPLSLFGQRAFSAGVAASLAFFAALGAFFLTITITLQSGAGLEPMRAGMALAPFSIATAIGSATSVALSRRHGRRVLQAGAVILACGLLALIAFFHTAWPAITVVRLIVPLAICGFGMGLVVAPMADVVMSGVHRRDAGAASGVLNAVYHVGMSTGVAVVGAIYFTAIGSRTGYLGAFERATIAEVALVLISALVMLGLPSSMVRSTGGARLMEAA